jgi:hypothetical protein
MPLVYLTGGQSPQYTGVGVIFLSMLKNHLNKSDAFKAMPYISPFVMGGF